MSLNTQLKHLLLALGVALLVFGLIITANYAFRMNSDLDWGERQLLYDLGFVALGIAFELAGLGIIMLGKK